MLQCRLFKEQLTTYPMALVSYLSQDRGNLSYGLKRQQGRNKSAEAGKSDHAQGSLFVTGLHGSQPSLSAGPQTRPKVISVSYGILRFMTITSGICLVKIKLANLMLEPRPSQFSASD